jgi:hypothetical protein
MPNLKKFIIFKITVIVIYAWIYFIHNNKNPTKYRYNFIEKKNQEIIKSSLNQTENLNITKKIQKLPESIIIGSPKCGM